MSFSSKLALGLACTVSFGTIVFVHYKQWSDKQKLHQGVINDIERQHKRKSENIYLLEKQIEMSKLLKKETEKHDMPSVHLLEDIKKSS